MTRNCKSWCKPYPYIPPSRPARRPNHGCSNLAPPLGWSSIGGGVAGAPPVTVTVDNPGIDVSILEIGCTYDAQLECTGKVYRRLVVNEDGSAGSDVFEWLGTGAPSFVPYVAGTHGDYIDCADEPVDVVECGCDDVAGDGSNIVKYFTLSRTHPKLGTYQIGVFEENDPASTAYTPVNPVDCNTLGSASVEKVGRVELGDGGVEVWSPTPLTISYTVSVQSIADVSNPPTFTDSFGNVTTFVLGESQTYDHNSALQSDGLAFVTANDGDRVIISYIELGA